MSRALVDPELLPLLDLLLRADLNQESLPLMRARSSPPPASAPRPGVVSSEGWSAPFASGAGARLRILRPAGQASPLPAYLHIHGGGYVAGVPEVADERNAELVTEAGCLVASVDYRLAPEHPYPAALHDCYSALLWLQANAQSLGVDGTRIAVGGESAGAGLAAAVCLLARDRGDVQPVAQLLAAPMLDDRTCLRMDLESHLGEFVWTPGSNHFGWTAYLGSSRPGAEDVETYAAPARARDLRHLAPAFIAVGALDLFAAENLDYAKRLLLAGVPTELHLYPGAFHAFNLSADAAVAKRYRGDFTNALRRALA